MGICSKSSCTRQYHLVFESKTWTEAQRYCRQNYTDLATIENMEEMKRLIKTVRGTFHGRPNATGHYVVIYYHKTWNEAQTYCREHHTDLVSIRNETENFRVQSLIPYSSVVWIGLYRTRSWSDQSNSSFSNWSAGQPDNAGNSEYCTAVSFSDSGNWTDENCNTALPFICYRALASSHQYHFVNESKTWTEAQRYCRQNYTDLATIDNMEEMNRLINTVNESYNDSAWIGLYDDVNSWRWSLEDNVLGKENSSQKYVWIYEHRTWTGAQSYCREKYTDLASVRNEIEHQQILNASS
ncbi:macrophage mannose receptor 1-like [Sinocyclocheilus rhinocerous]|uniref:macrophage mannose receptor 1-like n=1 Tax=Sinocyclocheilus rhinocerous TaxID=307959 RepID=UPI0007B99F05|nr:PREDICTED: macrophage mannose receptor 1-like [Sinocyclocheilus rhinocerous]